MPTKPSTKSSNDLFAIRRNELADREAPLAARMRPRTLDEFIGQEHIVGPGRLLRRAIQADQLSSVIFYGPPGTGKTTLARIIANTTRGHFIAINAVLAGVADIRAAIAEAQERRGQFGQRTILFVDEVHRFNKAQQDALLPWVENGTVNRKPLFRGQQGARQPLAHLPAQAAQRRRPVRRRAAGAGRRRARLRQAQCAD